MKSMEEVWQKQMRSLQSSLSIAKKSLAVDESERSSDASINTSDDREYCWDTGNNLKVPESNGLRPMSAGLSVISRLAEEFEQRSQVFGDDAKFLVEVKSGQVDASLNPDRELRRLKQMFETWKKDYATRLRETKVVLNKLGSEDGALDKVKKKFWGRRNSTRCLTSINPVRYATFKLNGDANVELMLDENCSTKNVVVELYAQFGNIEEGGLSS
ncbi:hypothetical protein Golax_000450 [Gossypium laxum]|uniref:Uncharacterized protein n=1 Tax=Gossypium laxum TaxID=34288 RepID=A0A7J9ATM6_9ROSI|nr:hypothetical protein [Gossypium laxum]